MSTETGDIRETFSAAPSGPIARAAVAFGDAYPPVTGQWRIRTAGAALILATLVYIPWLVASLNERVPWLAWPFLAANLFTVLAALLNVRNAWSRHVPPSRALPQGAEPTVGVIVPTCGEPVAMILRTVESILEQDWPREKLVIVVSDDGNSPLLARACETLPVVYHRPPRHGDPERRGDAKAGNLNSALALIDAMEIPGLRYIETRDADDELGSTGFLRQTIGQLEHDHGLAFVQTIKEAEVSPGDPFNNRESMFYRGQMLARNASNAVFPCGSGVVWRRTALRSIGEFPTWNLVEDIQSGVEALRRGWRGLYLPIVGAVGQHSPEDVPNVYKQRGTWAVDTVRLVVWGDLRGLSLAQRAHFYELLLYYLNGFTTLVYLPAVACSLLGWVPLQSSTAGFVLHLLPLVVASELWLLVLHHPYNDRRKRQRHRVRALWQVRTIWAGLAPIFIRASILAIVNGPNRKPTYKVTRKTNDVRWHWRHTLPQTTLVLAVAVVAITALRFGRLPNPVLLAGSVYWGGLNIVLLTNFVTRGWHGLHMRLFGPHRLQTQGLTAQER